MIKPIEIEKLAKEIAKDAYFHNSGSSLNPTVCRMMRIELETKIYDALLIIQNQAYEEAARIAEELELDQRYWTQELKNGWITLKSKISQAIRYKIVEKAEDK